MNQNRFRWALAKRDALCLVTDQENADAAHILIQSRPEYYTEIFGYDPVKYFRVRFGLFVSRDLHHSYDRGGCAILPFLSDRAILIFDVFDEADAMTFHGKGIPASRFRVAHQRDLPHQRLSKFHYREYLIKHIRGFEFSR